MSDAIKWGILGASIVVIIALILSLPIVSAFALGTGEIAGWVSEFIYYTSTFLQGARGIINVFLFPIARSMLSVLMNYLIFGWAYKTAIKIVVWVYHWLFK